VTPRDAEPRFLEPVLGIAFDLDGTLILSHHDFGRMRSEVVRLAEKYGVVPGHLTVERPIHQIVEAAREELRQSGASDGTFYRFEAEYQKRIDTIELEALARTTPRPGADALLGALQARGFRLGILTRASEVFARQALNRTDLGKYFPYLRSRSAPGPAKPSPESLISLLKEMGTPLDRALFVGDHLIDAECATAARVRFYAVLPDPSESGTSAMSEDRFLAAGAAAIAKDLLDLARQLGVAPTVASQ
jgi:HAD superfamily hydrolase (TIGR01549 family)